MVVLLLFQLVHDEATWPFKVFVEGDAVIRLYGFVHIRLIVAGEHLRAIALHDLGLTVLADVSDEDTFYVTQLMRLFP
jgi:hypothetical protein